LLEASYEVLEAFELVGVTLKQLEQRALSDASLRSFAAEYETGTATSH
jgi:hypothetical protein